MRNRFDRQLLELNNELIQMGSLIEQAIEMGISALVKQDVEKAEHDHGHGAYRRSCSGYFGDDHFDGRFRL